MKEVNFSIVIPVYNAQNSIVGCVQSVLQQVTDQFEIILVNDGSTDTSGDVCDSLASTYPDYIRVIHSTNEGAFRARLRGVNAASGMYICFMDADDFWEPDAVDLILSFPHEHDFIMFAYHEIKGGPVQVKLKSCPPFAPGAYTEEAVPELREVLMKSDIINSLWSKIIKRDLIPMECLYDDRYLDLSYAEDFLVLMYICERVKSFFVSHDIIYDYVENVTSTTQMSLSQKSLNSLLFVYERYFEIAHRWNLPEDMMRRRITEQVVHGLYPLMYGHVGLVQSNRNRIIREELIASIISPRFVNLCRSAMVSLLPLAYRFPVLMLRIGVISLFRFYTSLFRHVKRMLSFPRR